MYETGMYERIHTSDSEKMTTDSEVTMSLVNPPPAL